MTFPTDKPDLSATRATADDDPLSTPNHRIHHVAEDDNLEGVMGKVGVTTSIPAPGTFFHSEAFENSAWATQPWLGNSYALRGKDTGGAIRRLIGMNPSDEVEVGDQARKTKIASVLKLAEGPNLIISATGSITVTHSYHRVDTFEGAGTDDLTRINGGSNGDILVLRSVSNARDIVVKNQVNMRIGADFTLTDIIDTITLMCREGGFWMGISTSNNG